MLSTLAAFALVALSLHTHGVEAQITSNATCLSNWLPLYNSKGQSPCLVAAYLGGVCNGGQYDVSALIDDQHYIGPTAALVNDCQCSTVMYSMISACSACQNATIITWSSWDAQCSDVSVDFFPNDIPQDTAVPGWAYENVTADGIFNPQQALQDNSPESTATISQSTQTASSSGATGSSTSPVGGANSPTSSGSSGSSSHTGAIAGGVVGGVVGAALLGLLAFFLIRRRRNNARAATKVDSPQLTGTTYGGAGGAGQGVFGSGMSQREYTPVPYTPNAYEGSGAGAGGMGQQQKLYDPNDPSTFPTASPSPNMNQQFTGQTYSSGQPILSSGGVPAQHSGANSGYRGVAEV